LDIPGNLTIRDSVVRNNTAGTYGGGALLQYYEDVAVLDSVISGNTAGDYAGGIRFYSTGDTLVSGSVIENNTAAAQGGGLMTSRATTGVFADIPGNLTIRDSVFRNNTAGGYLRRRSGTALLRKRVDHQFGIHR